MIGTQSHSFPPLYFNGNCCSKNKMVKISVINWWHDFTPIEHKQSLLNSGSCMCEKKISNWDRGEIKEGKTQEIPTMTLSHQVKCSCCVPHIVLSILNKLFSHKNHWCHISVSLTARFTQTADSNPFLKQLYLIGSFIKARFLPSVSHRNQFVHNPMNSGALAPVWRQGPLPT